MIRATFKQKMLIVFLILVLIRITPDFIARKGWKNIGAGWVYIALFAVLLWTKFVDDYSHNQAVRKMREWQSEMSKKTKASQRKKGKK